MIHSIKFGKQSCHLFGRGMLTACHLFIFVVVYLYLSVFPFGVGGLVVALIVCVSELTYLLFIPFDIDKVKSLKDALVSEELAYFTGSIIYVINHLFKINNIKNIPLILLQKDIT